MNIDQLGDLGLCVIWGLLFAFAAWVISKQFGNAIDEAKESQMVSSGGTLSELYINISPQTFLMLRVLAFLVLFAIGHMAVNPIAGAFLGSFGFIVPWFLLKRLRWKRVKTIETQLVEALELLGNGLKSGMTLQQAIEMLVREFPPPITQEFNLLLAETRLGVDLNDALKNMANRLNSTICDILATGVAITKKCGGDLTVIFGNIAQTIREQATIEGKLDSVTAQGKFQGLILSIMPFALIVILWFVDRDHVETLFGYQIGIYALLLVVGMVIMAQVWISRLLDIDV